MEYMAKWGPKGFLVSPSKIVPLEGLHITGALKADSGNTASGGSNTTNKRGRELVQVTFSTQYSAAVGVDPRAQLEEWDSLIGEAYPLMVGEKRFGPEKLILTNVDASEIQVTPSGAITYLMLSITMEEYVEKVAQTTTTTKSKETPGTPGKTFNDASKKQALGATPGANDKNSRKPVMK